MTNSMEDRLEGRGRLQARPALVPDWPDEVDASGLTPWLVTLTWFEGVDAACFDWILRASGGSADDRGWEAFATWIVEAGGADWVRLGRRSGLVLTEAWAAKAHAMASADPQWCDSARAQLVEAWLDLPDKRYLDSVTVWARGLGRWDLLARIWREHLNGLPTSRHPDAFSAFRSLPDAARRQHPCLTWAVGVAEGAGSDDPLRAALRTVIRDGVLLHSSWYLHEDLDAAVFAGSIWMHCQRMLPGDGFARGLNTATRTAESLERLIADRAQRGISPSDTVRTIFAVVSADTALSLGDLSKAASRASLATIVQGAGPEMDAVARGIIQLSQAIGGLLPLSPAQVGELRPRDGNGLCLMARAGWVMSKLAEGVRALDRLDRAGCEEVLTMVGAEDAWGASVGTIRAYLEAVHGALWVSPEQALATLDATIATHAGRTPEAAEPLGARLVGRARAFVLCRLGALEASKSAAADLPEQCRQVAQARAHLCAGEMDEAALVAAEGLLDSHTWLKDRLQLTVLKNAAIAADPMSSSDERAAATSAIIDIASDQRALLALALPRRVRQELLSVAKSVASADPAAIRLLEDRFAELVDAPDSDAPRVRLTMREQVILPLLATSQTVPEIARSLHVSPNTVRKQVVALRAKFQAGNRADLIRHARHSGFLR